MRYTTKIRLSISKQCCYGYVLVFLTLVSGCIHIPVPSRSTIEDKLQAMNPIEEGDVVVVDGTYTSTGTGQSFAESVTDYFTYGCRQTLGNGNTKSNLIGAILKVNPRPGKFVVKDLVEVEKEGDPDCTAGSDSILCRLNLSKNRISIDHLRYAIYVKENFETKVHVPLYAPPFGIASCGHRTVLEADVWELPTEKFVGSFTVAAAGEFAVAAYMAHLAFYSNTQKDATERLAREIVEKLTGLKLLEAD
jgi:hypothetical protein